MLSKALVSYNAHKLLHHNRPQAYFRRYSIATLAEIWTRYIQQTNLADSSCLQVDLQCSVYINSSTIISSPLPNTILPEGHHRSSSRDLTTRLPSTRKHPGHTQCLLTSHTHPSMVRVNKLAEETWTQESWTHPQLSTAQLMQMMEEMVTLNNFAPAGPRNSHGHRNGFTMCQPVHAWLSYAEEPAQLDNSKTEHVVEIH